MTAYNLEKRLDLLIELLETLPKRICNEMERREAIDVRTELMNQLASAYNSQSINKKE